MPSGAPGRRVKRASLWAALLAYSVLLAGSAALHHDFACHQTSRSHCTACTWAQMASGVESDDPSGTALLPPAGDAHGGGASSVETLVPLPSFGRSPPLA